MGVNVRGIAYGLACAVLWVPGTALGQGKSGTTLSASKTIDICVQRNGQWRFSGVITVTNGGDKATEGLTITDWVEWKKGDMDWEKLCDAVVNGSPGEIPAGETRTFEYACVSWPPAVSNPAIRNQALVTITNHSGKPGQAFGPNPKASWEGALPPPACRENLGCTYTQGYWKNHATNWPTGYEPSALFYSSGQTWLQVLWTEPKGGNAYYILAHQYIAAVLNKANGAYVPAEIQSILTSAASWFSTSNPSSCAEKGSCQPQKNWAAVLDTYNRGEYPGGPPHCGDGTGY
jgi:hypothetical protein